MSALAINRRDEEMHGAVRGRTTLTGFGSRASVDHHQSNPAHSATSLARRTLAGASRSRPFIRIGWGCALNELAAVRRLIASGVEERAATHLAADHPSVSGSCQGITERDPHSSKPLRQTVSDGSEAIEKDFARGTEPFVGAAKSYD